MGILSFCEGWRAGSRSRLHLRWLDEAGPKFGGGITTSSLCGIVKPLYGWDMEIPLKEKLLDFACPYCLAKLAER